LSFIPVHSKTVFTLLIHKGMAARDKVFTTIARFPVRSIWELQMGSNVDMLISNLNLRKEMDLSRTGAKEGKLSQNGDDTCRIIGWVLGRLAVV
jgi:hypothetical protein